MKSLRQALCHNSLKQLNILTGQASSLGQPGPGLHVLSDMGPGVRLFHHQCNLKHCGSRIVHTSPYHRALLQLCHNSLTQSDRGFGLWGNGRVNEWNNAVSEAEKIVGYPTSFMSLRCLLSDELSNVAMQMRKLVGTKHPLLKTARKFFYDGKHSMQTRGLLVLLVSKAAGASAKQGSDVLEPMVSGIYPKQRSLAEITEMIHTANLIHKGVIDLATLQPADGSLQDMEFGNKMAVLSGDFLLATASTALADLENTYVVEFISGAIGDLMKAEFTNFRDANGNHTIPTTVTISDWERQAYLSSGSLISKSCKSALLLACHGGELQNDAALFGEYISYAHQIHEDLQPIIKPDEEVNYNGSFITSAPFVLHAMRNNMDSSIRDFISHPPEPSKFARLMKETEAVEDSKQLCVDYGNKALEALKTFPTSDAKSALQNIVKAVTSV